MNYKIAKSGNADIYYHERGTGESLVLIMGFGADGTVWEKHAAAYEKYFRCIILDNRGVGLSDQSSRTLFYIANGRRYDRGNGPCRCSCCAR